MVTDGAEDTRSSSCGSPEEVIEVSDDEDEEDEVRWRGKEVALADTGTWNSKANAPGSVLRKRRILRGKQSVE